MVAAHVVNRTFKVRESRIPRVLERAKRFTGADVDNQVLGQIVIDPSEEEMSRGVDRISIVIDRFITIFADQTCSGAQVKYKLLAQRVLNTVLIRRVLNTVLRISVRRGSEIHALECVACHQGKSGRRAIGKPKNVNRVVEVTAYVLRTNVGLEIGLVLVSSINAGVEGKPT